MRLTKGFVDKIKLADDSKPVFYWDSEVKGYGLKVSQTKKVYIAQAKVRGKSKRVTIGTHGKITEAQARDRAKKELLSMLDGIDPSATKAREKALDVTLKQIATDYIKARSLKTLTVSDINNHLKRNFKEWQDRPAAKITRLKVSERFQALTERSPAQANQAFRVLRSLLNYARATYRDIDDMPILPENPVQVLSDAKMWNRIQPRSGKIPMDKIGTAWNLIQALRTASAQTKIGRTLVDATAFLMLTGCRINEVCNLTWDRVNLEECWWHIDDPKNHHSVTFPLSALACKILTDRPRTSAYVFPSKSKTGHITEMRTPLKKISKEAGVNITAHDMRRTFKSIADECGVELWKCKLLLNHQDRDVTIDSYTETSNLRYLQPEIEKISQWIERQGKIAEAENVVPFPTQKQA